jgi:prevent-host-death family protein
MTSPGDIPRIPQRELRNDSGRVLREVRAGQSYVITVDGVPVADLVPHSRAARRTAVPRDDVLRAFAELLPSSGLRDESNEVVDDSIYDPYDRAYRRGEFAPKAPD